MKAGRIKSAALALSVLLILWADFGGYVVIGGLCGVMMWLLPPLLMIVGAEKRLLGRAAVILLAAAYLLAGGVYLLRASSRTVRECALKDGVYHLVYETDAGAVGHRAYHYLTYYSFAESDLLTLRLRRSEDSYRYDDFIPRPWAEEK